jgi:dTDP-4-amino-4,6-dideoxygalactose transaminase
VKVPLLDLPALHAPIREELLAAMTRVLDSGTYILGQEVEAFEKAAAAYCGARCAVGLSNGTDALVVALRALDLGPADEVIVPAFSFVATATSVVMAGARPVFVDIDPRSFNIDPKAVAQAITPRTRAIMPVHLFGRPADLDPILKHGLPVIEDAAQAIGAGPLRGDVSCLSFFPAKNLGALGDAGMLLTNREALADKARQIRHHGSKSKYRHERLGSNYRLDPLQAAVLNVKLRHLDRWTTERRATAALYRRQLNGVTSPEDAPGHVYNQFVIRSSKRDALQKPLTDAGVGTAIYYPETLPSQPIFGSIRGGFPNAEQTCREVLALPVAPGTTPEAVAHVCRIVNSVSR